MKTLETSLHRGFKVAMSEAEQEVKLHAKSTLWSSSMSQTTFLISVNTETSSLCFAEGGVSSHKEPRGHSAKVINSIEPNSFDN